MASSVLELKGLTILDAKGTWFSDGSCRAALMCGSDGVCVGPKHVVAFCK